MENVRDIAIRALTRVLSDSRPLDESIDELARGLEGSERAWLMDVCSGVLRHKGRLDSIIDSLSLKKKPTGWLRKVLLMATYQLLEQDRAEPALVVNDTVTLVKKREGAAPSQFVNALLRRVSSHREDWKNAQEPKPNESPESQAAWFSLPHSWWKKLHADYGNEWLRSFAKSSLLRPEIYIKLKPGTQVQDFMEATSVDGAYRIKEQRPSGSVVGWPGFMDGEWIVQDLASQILVHEMMDLIRKNKSSPLVLDRCASPGGKSVSLAWSGARTVSSDLGSARMSLLKETCSRVKNAFEVVDGAQAYSRSYDCVWVDAPCSGSGILRRHPDVKWLKADLKLTDLLLKQKALLVEAYEKISSGAYLMYSVCSVFKEEGSGQIEKLGWKSQVIREWNLGPHHMPSTDGFYGVLIQKK